MLIVDNQVILNDASHRKLVNSEDDLNFDRFFINHRAFYYDVKCSLDEVNIELYNSLFILKWQVRDVNLIILITKSKESARSERVI